MTALHFNEFQLAGLYEVVFDAFAEIEQDGIELHPNVCASFDYLLDSEDAGTLADVLLPLDTTLAVEDSHHGTGFRLTTVTSFDLSGTLTMVCVEATRERWDQVERLFALIPA